MTARKPEKSGRNQANGRDRAGRWAQGNSGNPAGRPRGARNRVTVLAEALAADRAEAIVRRLLDLAEAGDPAALRLVVERLWPKREAGVEIGEAPKLERVADLPAALAALLGRVAVGDVAPAEGARIAALLDAWRGAVESTDLEARIAALESQTGDAQ